MYKFGILDSMDNKIETKVIGSTGQVIGYESKNELDLPETISELDAAMVWHNINISDITLHKLKKCKVLVRVGVGFDNVDCAFAGSIGLPVVNIPDYGTNDVADHAFALLLTVCRKTAVYNEALTIDATQNWQPNIGGTIHRFTGKTMGIIGMGRIGAAVATRAKAFGMNIAFYDPYLPDGYDKVYQAKCVENIKELFAICDYISVHSPATNETNGMINKEVISYSKKGLTLINTARGNIVSLDAIYYGLKKGLIENFAADVLECEPPNKNHKLIKAYTQKENWLKGRIIITPHSAFYAVESRNEMRVKSAQQMLNAVQGVPLKNCVNKQYLVNSRSTIK